MKLKKFSIGEEVNYPDYDDSAIVSKIRLNRDGSITANVQIDVDIVDGRSFQTLRKLRLYLRKDGD